MGKMQRISLDISGNDSEIESLRQKVHELEKVEQQFHSLLSATEDFVYIKDAEHRFLASSSAHARAIGLSHWRELVGKTDRELFTHELADQFLEQEESVLKRGQEIVQLEEYFYDTDGNLSWVSSNKSPLYDDAGAIIGLIGISRDITDKKLSEEKLRYLSSHDYLTGLPNRGLFMEASKLALSTSVGEQCSVLIFFLDVNNFKQINDQYGHAAGDILLIEIAKRLKSALRVTDVVSRFGGDEFTILTVTGEVELMRNKILKCFDENVDIGTGQLLDVSISVGVAKYPEHGRTIDNLIKAADSAMYKMKLCRRISD